jgi:hypothetical protein
MHSLLDSIRGIFSTLKEIQGKMEIPECSGLALVMRLLLKQELGNRRPAAHFSIWLS